MLDQIIEILKFVGIAFAGLFGILGVTTQYRDDDGKITKWGRTAVIGTIVSTMVAFSSQSLEFRREAQQQRAASESAIKQARTNTALLEQLARAVDPLNLFEVTAWVRVDLDTPELASYRARVLAAIDEAVKAAKPNDSSLKNGIRVVSRYANGGNITSVSIGMDSPSFPDRRTEPVAYYLIRYLDLSFNFQKPSQAKPADNQYVLPELEIAVGTADPPATVSLEYNLEKEQFTIEGSSMQTPPKFWQNYGNVLAVPDLYKMRLAVAVRSIVMPALNDRRNAAILRNRDKLSISTMVIRLPRGRELWIKNWPSAKHGASGLPFYNVALPRL